MEPQACAPRLHRLATDQRRRRALISMTPLIDVVFILLIFFMLASSFLHWRVIGLDLPNSARSVSAVADPVLVDIDVDGIRIGDSRLNLDQLAERVAKNIAEDPEQRILIRPAPGVPLQDAVAVLDRLAANGVVAMTMFGQRGTAAQR